jgi:hypothetical protein
MTQVRELYVGVAEAAVDLLASPEVADSWSKPSALAGFSVQGLAGHLAGQIFFLPAVLADPVPDEEVIGLHEYYARAGWIGSELDTPFNAGIRSGGEAEAADGPAELVARAAACVESLRYSLPDTPNRPVRRPTWGPWSITFDDFVASRMLELVIHSDDLAYSVGRPTPDFEPAAAQLVVDVLSRIAVRRHGAVDVLRALSRSERAPAGISAL